MPKLKCRLVNTVIDRKIEPKIPSFPKKTLTRVGAQPAVMAKSKEENAILANEKLKHVMNKIGIGVEIDEVQRVDKADTERCTSRNEIVNWQIRIHTENRS